MQLLLQGAGHLRTISLDTSASNFLQSLQLHDVSALQAGMLDAAEAAALDQQYDAAAMAAASGRPYAAASPKFAGAAAAVAAAAAGDHGWQPAEGAAVSAGSKRAHSGNGRVGKDSLQEGKKESLHQHKHSFTPALPAVDEAEDAAGPSDRCGAGQLAMAVTLLLAGAVILQRAKHTAEFAAQLLRSPWLQMQWPLSGQVCNSTSSVHLVPCCLLACAGYAVLCTAAWENSSSCGTDAPLPLPDASRSNAIAH
jgi:hypothetical protein